MMFYKMEHDDFKVHFFLVKHITINLHTHDTVLSLLKEEYTI